MFALLKVERKNLDYIFQQSVLIYRIFFMGGGPMKSMDIAAATSLWKFLLIEDGLMERYTMAATKHMFKISIFMLMNSSKC